MTHGGGAYEARNAYQVFLEDDEAPLEVEENNETQMDDSVRYRVVPDRLIDQWNHIEDLDAFFRRVYTYHQKHGFTCMFVEGCLKLQQFVFVIIFITFLFSCVDYAVLFGDKPVGGHNTTDHVKVRLKDAIMPPGKCYAGLPKIVQIGLIVILILWLIRVVIEIFQMRHYLDVRRFYINALHILPHELDCKSWNDVQRQLLQAQRDHEMCVHKKELTELDVYHRILRYDNYIVAMVNKEVIPVKIQVPFIGTVPFFSTGYRFNLDFLLFWGVWSPFQNSWQLKEEYKAGTRRDFLTEEFSRSVFWVGIANLILLPFILIWQSLSVIFSYADVIRREPGYLGSRMWSEYARIQLRHFNELEHELNNRLSKAHQPATLYMNAFTSHLTVVLCRNVVFFAGSLWVVLVGLTIWDEDFLAVDHIVFALASLSMILACCRSAIPNENVIWCPEKLMQAVLCETHYTKPHWRGNANSPTVKDEFSDYFIYKFSHLLSEVLSPLVTPFILLGPVRANSRRIVNFLCDNTVSVPGSGDVCSFALMKINEHGSPDWHQTLTDGKSDLAPSKQAENGKTELSLLHFAHTNPAWQPEDQISQNFIRNVKSHLENNPPSIALPPGQTLDNSLYSYSLLNSFRPPGDHPVRGGGVTSARGPVSSFMSTHEDSFVQSSLPGRTLWPPMQPTPCYESLSTQMSASAIFLHERRHSARSHPFYTENSRRSKPLNSIGENVTEKSPLLLKNTD